ncbi:MAG: alpha/beta hydrolase fold domain-containing protein [Streptosporangiales bacterium]|nr:alpha/beta hydrolase fold domain-containing protein [Streptosporangiales bacterium]
MTAEERARCAALIREAGSQVTPETIQAMFELFAPAHRASSYGAPHIERDLGYGSDPRHRLDVHTPTEPGAASVPVLLFVHGGGFVGGDKHTPDTPYYDHVGGWAVGRGLLGVTMTYRLAPQHGWPAGAEDVAAAVAWVRAHIGGYGGDPERIVLAGHSAGAAHVASYLARYPEEDGPDKDGVAAAAMFSGIYDLETAERNDLLRSYFGPDPVEYSSRSPLPGLLGSRVPMLFSVAELDPPDFHRQAAVVLEALFGRDGAIPPFVWVQGHNHISEIASLGVDDEALGVPLLRFIEHAVTLTSPVGLSARPLWGSL